jgi:hypothetical protein
MRTDNVKQRKEVMDPKKEKWNDAKDHHSIPASKEDFIHEQTEKIGRLRKFLDWLSKGAAKSKTDPTNCPT